MKNKNLIKEMSYSFSIRIVKLFKYLQEEKKEFVLSKQILKSGTSIGANVEEADSAQSKKDFIAKIQISLKEAKETHYWIRLLRDTYYLEEKLAASLLDDCNSIISILTSILKTSKNNIKNER